MRARKWTEKFIADQYFIDIELEAMKIMGTRADAKTSATQTQSAHVPISGYDPIEDSIPF